MNIANTFIDKSVINIVLKNKLFLSSFHKYRNNYTILITFHYLSTVVFCEVNNNFWFITIAACLNSQFNGNKLPRGIIIQHLFE